MAKSRYPAFSSALVLCIEVEQERTERGTATYAVIVSRPGREGTLRRSWSNPSGRLTTDQGADMGAWVSKAVLNALLVWGGLQEALEV